MKSQGERAVTGNHLNYIILHSGFDSTPSAIVEC